MGSPSVFHTAPPHPASNARITWSPQLAGGPDASQNGFGQRIFPAKSVVRSAIQDSRLIYAKVPRDPNPRPLSVGHRIHHFATAVHAIASREIFRIRSLAAFPLHHHATAIHRHV